MQLSHQCYMKQASELQRMKILKPIPAPTPVLYVHNASNSNAFLKKKALICLLKQGNWNHQMVVSSTS